MSDSHMGDDGLGKKELFRLLTDEVYRDGVVDDWEMEAVLKVARFLHLRKETAQEIASRSRQAFEAGALGDESPLDPHRLYRKVLDHVLADGQIDDLERNMLKGLRQLFSISQEEHDALLGKTGELALSLSPAAAPDEEPAKADSPSPSDFVPPEADIPGLWLDALQAEQQAWVTLRREASPNFGRAWNGILQSSFRGPFAAYDQAARALEDAGDDPRVPPIDAAACLSLVRHLRCFLRSTIHEAAHHWEAGEHFRVSVRTLVNVLLTIHGRGRHEAFDQALDLALVDLWLIVVHVIHSRRPEVLPELFHLVQVMALVSPRHEANHYGAEILETVEEALSVSDGGCLESFLGLCKKLCEKLMPNDVLALAAHHILERLRPKDCVIDGSKPPRKGRTVPMSSPLFPRLKAAVERLRRQTEAFARFKAIAGKTDFSKLVSFFDDIEKKAGSPEAARRDLTFQKGNVIVTDPTLHPRPLVFFVCAGDPSLHLEAFKGTRIELSFDGLQIKKKGEEAGKPIDEMTMLSASPCLSDETTLLYPPLEGAAIKTLLDALNRAHGHYDVVLLSRDLEPLRWWQGVGDLDPSNNLSRANAARVAGKADEARAHCDAALAACPWLSSAHLLHGLICKDEKDFEGARKHFERALELQPHDPLVHARLGVLAKQQQRFDEAVTWLERALDIRPTQPSALVTLASTHLTLEHQDPIHYQRWCYYLSALHLMGGMSGDLVSLLHGVGAKTFDHPLVSTLGSTPVDVIFAD